MHDGVPWRAWQVTAQAPHADRLSTVLVVAQALLQQLWPEGQPWAVLHPATQAPLAQSAPGGHCASVVHPWQVWLVRSQVRPEPPSAALQSASAPHCTQEPCTHTAPDGLLAQSPFVEQPEVVVVLLLVLLVLVVVVVVVPPPVGAEASTNCKSLRPKIALQPGAQATTSAAP
jgi:hypothetical protein